YGRVDDTLYLHGSSANATFMAAAGRQVCVTVTHLDGLVCARAVFSHSMNYRSAMIYGIARLLTGQAERIEALLVITEHLTPGQWSYARQPTARELAATSVLELPLTEATVKIRDGGPADEPEGYALAVWAGRVPAPPRPSGFPSRERAGRSVWGRPRRGHWWPWYHGSFGKKGFAGNTGQPRPYPVKMNDRLVWIDCEMTGLDIERDAP